MEIKSCSFDELLKLYSNAGQQGLADMVSSFPSEKYPVSTFHVIDEKEKLELIVAISFCDGGNNKTDLVVVGFATNTDVEKPSSTLEKFLNITLGQNPEIVFDLVSFTFFNLKDDDPRVAPYFDEMAPGYRPVISSFILPGIRRVRLAHDAKAFQSMHSR